jgi:hypothetical protein
VKVEIEVDDEMYKLAQEWEAIEKANPFPETKTDPKSADPEWMKAFDLKDELWIRFLKSHNLIIKKRPMKFLGYRIPNWGMKNKKEFDRALTVLRLKGGK